MKTLSSHLSLHPNTPLPTSKKEQIINYYEKAGRDYHTWSPNYNMHFGYFEKGMNPLAREAMLEKLNQKVFQKLELDTNPTSSVADLGCGLGATLRYGARNFPQSQFKGITIVPWQASQANEINIKTLTNPSRVEIIVADYCHTPFPNNSLDAVYAIESSCYATGADKSDLLREIYRVLKPGGRFVISDGFIKEKFNPQSILGHAYRTLCSSWALTELGNINAVRSCLTNIGFTNINTEEISMHVAPSVAHVPHTVIGFLLKELFFGKEKMNKERWDNLKSPLLTMILGSARKKFGYYFVTGRKP